jgi:hypothetical protein
MHYFKFHSYLFILLFFNDIYSGYIHLRKMKETHKKPPSEQLSSDRIQTRFSPNVSLMCPWAPAGEGGTSPLSDFEEY